MNDNEKPGESDAPAWQSQIPAASTAFFLDVDGTLLGFKSRPEEVVADTDLLTLLQTLQAAADGAVALVSGRMVSDLDRIVTPLLLPAGGVHGADIRFADQRRLSVGAAAMDPVRAPVTAFVEARPGLMLEDKGATLAVHYRHAPEREAEVRAFLADIQAGHDVAVQEGKLVAELKPVDCNKGHAIIALMKTAPFIGRRAFFMGDDLTDEHGFEAVNEAGGISVKVGGLGVTTLAQFKVADVAEARALLQKICRLAV
ncbi:trehalose-phosphatase [Beijerinckia sp. L45]|uniref:trehalose-phosphatase n=1 Tax=Beijerinckia sp. L45 TaxID=1641855 RepID=UPI00131C5F24|nr:trehalose-phosphatase [Beijerinckia sp. L45]